MNQICIARKVSQNGVDYLDFALNDEDKLMVWNAFKEASEFLKKEVGENTEELLSYILTTVEAHKGNPYMEELIKKGVFDMSSLVVEEAPVPEVSEPTTEPTPGLNMVDVECYFVLNCSQFEVINSDSILDKTTGRQLVPVIAFIDVTKPNELAQTPNFVLKHSFIGVVDEKEPAEVV